MAVMTITDAKTPWHLWLVGIVGLLWNAFGALDFAMSVTMGDGWYRMAKMTGPQMAFMHGYPAWMYVVWFAGTWGALIGSVLLLLRLRWAVQAFAVSLIGFLASLVYAYFLSDAQSVLGDTTVMHIAIFVGCVFFLWYAWTMAKRGVLR
ncbi:hypothetical protein BH10PSE2_BH10PSE2_18470 [soil metagenome]